MKYRGLFEQTNRKKLDSGGYVLNYATPVGAWTLAEGLEIWKRRYGGKGDAHADDD